MYSKDAWRFPLMHTERMNHPEGESIIFTDSIPLAALIVKPFVRWLPDGFHYLGLWHGLAFILQAVSATFLIRAFGLRSLIACFAAAFFYRHLAGGDLARLCRAHILDDSRPYNFFIGLLLLRTAWRLEWPRLDMGPHHR